MQDILAESLKRLKRNKIYRTRMIALVLVLSLVVSINVFWTMRQPGLALAGTADCNIIEHTHDAACQSGNAPCLLPEHVHSIDCYADLAADVETQIDWQKLFADYPFTGDLRQDLVGIAKTQVGYTESALNFEIDSSGTRHGYTRYGAWYGAPYNDWSAMFVSFCLHYAGADEEDFPGNIGAASIAKLWKNRDKYVDTGQYTPVSGDLVFFKDNTVGIVVQVYSASFYVICGDIDDAVQGMMLSLTDPSIVGWGITQTQGEEKPPDTDQTQNDPLDLSDGPIFNIYTASAATSAVQRYMLRNMRMIIDLLPYLEANDGSYFFTLLDRNNVELPKDAQGNYIAQSGEQYKLTISFTSPEGFLPGTYQYQVPNGLMVDGGQGIFVLDDDEEVGTWTVTDTGLITLEFNEHINSRTEITISAALGIHFPEQDTPIDFDGKISVIVQKPQQQMYPTTAQKGGLQGGDPFSWGDDPTKIYWHIIVAGNKDSQIPGSIVHDKIYLGPWSKTHRYTASDIAGGLDFEVYDPYGNRHIWHVTADDPHLIWDEFEWSYKIPKTVVCDHCGELELGNEGWYYNIHYSSTPDYAGTAGSFGYENEVTVDGAYAYSWVNFSHGSLNGTIQKEGSFITDAAGGAFVWEVQTTIPGRPPGLPAENCWYVNDQMRIYNAEGVFVGYIENDSNLSTVYATYNGNTFQVPRIQDATENDLFAWDIGWNAVDNGVTYGRALYLLTRCTCTAESCHWDGGCDAYWFTQDNGVAAQKDFCQCWTVTENVTFTFVYTTKDLSSIEKYGGSGYQLHNSAELFYIPKDAYAGASVDYDDVYVPIPGIFKKELTHDFNKYTAAYKITVNEAKLVLTDGSPLLIHDVMTDTLAFISGSLVITAEDGAGNITTLRQGEDYTVTYDGTGTQKDEGGKPAHILDILILHPQPVKYTLEYDTTLIYPEQVSGGIKYSNSASITLWGQQIKDNSVEKVYADINIAAKSYRVELYKTSAENNQEYLPGAVFGLYNDQGGLITTATTDNNGHLYFQTNIVQGIILREHVLYYIQEMRPPPGYKLDETKHWFCFCDKKIENCAACNEVIGDETVKRIPFEQIGKFNLQNEVASYELPATGGSGIYPLILVSAIFIITPLVYMSVCKRKRERRGVG